MAAMTSQRTQKSQQMKAFSRGVSGQPDSGQAQNGGGATGLPLLGMYSWPLVPWGRQDTTFSSLPTSAARPWAALEPRV